MKTWKWVGWLTILAATVVIGREAQAQTVQANATAPRSLADLRRGFATTLTRKEVTGGAPSAPPDGMFQLVHYPSTVGNLAAYLSVSPGDGKKHPIVIWLFGGFDNSIDGIAWTPGPPGNDQSATAFRDAGLLMMYPSLRGGNDNPGYKEAFYGEVDDVLSAIAYAKKQDFVDPQRIYLGGHSTGGTLALLVAESTSDLRSVFAFGPVYNVRGYGAENLPFDTNVLREVALRSPGRWLRFIHEPTYVFEGTDQPSNIGQLRFMERVNTNSMVHFVPVSGATHFSGLAPESRLIATKILADTNAIPGISFQPSEVAEALTH